MKKWLYFVMLLGVSIAMSACVEKSEESGQVEVPPEVVTETEPIETVEEEVTEALVIDHEDFTKPVSFIFSSGAGGWWTELTLSQDGAFEGKYIDSNAGDSGAGYEGSVSISEFTGTFEIIEKVDAFTYSLQLQDIAYKVAVGEEWIEDRTKFTASDAYGLEGKRFMLYNGEKEISGLDEDFLSWGRRLPATPGSTETLGVWGLHNLEMNYGFYSSEVVDSEEETAVEPSNIIPVDYDVLDFYDTFDGEGSEFIGTWTEVNDTTIEYAPNPWEIHYQDGYFYIRAMLPGDPGMIVMTALYEDGKLISTNATQLDLMNYQNAATGEIELPETIEASDESSQFFFEDGYLQWVSEFRGDMRTVLSSTSGIKGYTKQ